MPKVLIACEMSGRVRTQFAARGWDATSCDLLPDEAHLWNAVPPTGSRCFTGNHYQGDVMDIIRDDWDLVIAHPPCTDLSQAGARYWKQKQADGRQQAAIDFFYKMLNLPRREAYVVVENPVGIINQYDAPDQVVQPWMFGDPLTKRTCLWYREARIADPYYETRKDVLPHLVPDRPVEPTMRTVTGGGSWKTDKGRGLQHMNNWEDSQGRARRHILRSITPEGFARACATQWGSYVEERRA